MTAGVYGLFDEKTLLCLYIGQSVNVEKRTANHLGKLRRGTHSLQGLQAYASQHTVIYRLLKEVDDEQRLGHYEVRFFERFKPLFFGVKPTGYRKQAKPYSKLQTKTCAVCRGVFTARDPRALYCNDACYYEGRKRDHTCEVCSLAFSSFSNVSRWCSQKCFAASRQVLQRCRQCTQEFTSSGKLGYCSNDCRYDALGYAKICEKCHRSFDAKRKDARFCSRECRFETISYRKNCSKCGVEFQAKHGNAKFCHEHSARKYYKSKVTGVDS